MFFPALVIIFGVIWLFNSLGIISTDIWTIILPVAVILIGISMFTNKKAGGCHWCGLKKKDENKPENQ